MALARHFLPRLRFLVLFLQEPKVPPDLGPGVMGRL